MIYDDLDTEIDKMYFNNTLNTFINQVIHADIATEQNQTTLYLIQLSYEILLTKDYVSQQQKTTIEPLLVMIKLVKM